MSALCGVSCSWGDSHPADWLYEAAPKDADFPNPEQHVQGVPPEQAQHSAFYKAHDGYIICLHLSTHDRYELLIVVTPAEAHVAPGCRVKQAPVMIAEKHQFPFSFCWLRRILLAQSHQLVPWQVNFILYEQNAHCPQHEAAYSYVAQPASIHACLTESCTHKDRMQWGKLFSKLLPWEAPVFLYNNNINNNNNNNNNDNNNDNDDDNDDAFQLMMSSVSAGQVLSCAWHR